MACQRNHLFVLCFAVLGTCLPVHAVEPVPDKLVVLTFDDSVASHYTVVRPLLKQYGFSATFFITEGFDFPSDKTNYMTWAQIAKLHRDGFEIGNHTLNHMSVTRQSYPRLREQVETVARHCEEVGIPRPITFAYPGNGIEPKALPILKELGIKLARRGGAPEYPYKEGKGVPYEPGVDHPLLIPSAGDARPAWTLEDFKAAVAGAKDGKIAVLQFHGVPDQQHPWVHTSPEQFCGYLEYLKAGGYRVVALRDILRYVDLDRYPDDPFAIIERRNPMLKLPR